MPRVVERTFGWLMRCRRLARDYERTIADQEAMVSGATVFIMTKSPTRYETGQPSRHAGKANAPPRPVRPGKAPAMGKVGR
jgi:hypothetical protein